jgi:hypothetical protein
MNTRKMGAAHSAQINWARANKLADHAEIAPGTARNYISCLKKENPQSWTQLCKLLDTDTTARNKTLKTHIQLAQNHTAPDRPSKGDPRRPARAGAPPENWDEPPNRCTGCDMNLLTALKKILDQDYTPKDIQEGLKFIISLRDSK